MVEPHSSNFRVITANFLGVRIFRKFTVPNGSKCRVILILGRFCFVLYDFVVLAMMRVLCSLFTCLLQSRLAL